MYDHSQRWVRKTLDTNADGTIESSQVFVHDSGQIVLDFQKTGTAAASNSDLANRYLWGTNVDELLTDEAVDDGSEDDNRWALTDHLNSVRDLVVYNPVSGTVSVVKHVAYDAFGNVTSDSAAAVKSLFLYTARPFDADTDLQNNLNRWYDLSTGRWMSVDPIGFLAGDVNLYRYVGSSPHQFTDPKGLSPVDDVIDKLKETEWENKGKAEIKAFMASIQVLKWQFPGLAKILAGILEKELAKHAKDDLAKRMFDNYLGDTEDPFELTIEDIQWINGGSLSQGKRINVKELGGWNSALAKATQKPGTNVELGGTLPGRIWDNGSIGVYSVEFDGHVCATSSSKLSAKWTGAVQIIDTFDLDPNWDYPKNSSRSPKGERRTRIGYILSLGTNYEVTSVRASATQKCLADVVTIRGVVPPDNDGDGDDAGDY